MIILIYLISLFNLQPSTFHLRQDEIIFDKLTGIWQRSDGKTQERWEKRPDGSFFSVMYRIIGADTTILEEVKTIPSEGKWIYTVQGAGNADIIRFPSVEVTATRVHFSNPAHDFPTDIVYELIDRANLNAFIVGPGEKGGRDTVWFKFKKIN